MSNNGCSLLVFKYGGQIIPILFSHSFSYVYRIHVRWAVKIWLYLTLRGRFLNQTSGDLCKQRRIYPKLWKCVCPRGVNDWVWKWKYICSCHKRNENHKWINVFPGNISPYCFTVGNWICNYSVLEDLFSHTYDFFLGRKSKSSEDTGLDIAVCGIFTY